MPTPVFTWVSLGIRTNWPLKTALATSEVLSVAVRSVTTRVRILAGNLGQVLATILALTRQVLLVLVTKLLLALSTLMLSLARTCVMVVTLHRPVLATLTYLCATVVVTVHAVVLTWLVTIPRAVVRSPLILLTTSPSDLMLETPVFTPTRYLVRLETLGLRVVPCRTAWLLVRIVVTSRPLALLMAIPGKMTLVLRSPLGMAVITQFLPRATLVFTPLKVARRRLIGCALTVYLLGRDIPVPLNCVSRGFRIRTDVCTCWITLQGVPKPGTPPVLRYNVLLLRLASASVMLRRSSRLVTATTLVKRGRPARASGLLDRR